MNWYKKAQINSHEQTKYLLDTDEENHWAENDIKELEEEQAYKKWEDIQSDLKRKEMHTYDPSQKSPLLRPFQNVSAPKPPSIEEFKNRLNREFKNDLNMIKMYKDDPKMIKMFALTAIRRADYDSGYDRNELKKLEKEYHDLLVRDISTPQQKRNKPIKKQQYEHKMAKVKYKISYYDFVIAYFINLGKLS